MAVILITVRTAVQIRGGFLMIKLLLAVVAVAVILLLAVITLAGILEAMEMEWVTRTIVRKDDKDDELETVSGTDDQDL